MSDFCDNRLEDDLDATLHLLDRQVLDSEGAFVGKVDDIELTEDADRTLRATGLLTGAAALVPRLGGDHDQGALSWWQQLNPVRAERTVPGCIPIDEVEHVGSGVTLRSERGGLVHLQVDAPEGFVHHRVGHLLGMHVVGPDGDRLRERVVEVRLQPDTDRDGNLRPRVTALLVGRARPGTLLGYDRAKVTRPVVLATVISWINRHTAELKIDDVDHVDWEAKTVRARALPAPLHELDSK